MAAFVLRRLAQAVLVMLAVGLIALFFVVINRVVDLLLHAVDLRPRFDRAAAAN